MVVDALKDGAAVGGDAGDEARLVTITAGDVEEGKQVAIGSEAGEGGEGLVADRGRGGCIARRGAASRHNAYAEPVPGHCHEG